MTLVRSSSMVSACTDDGSSTSTLTQVQVCSPDHTHLTLTTLPASRRDHHAHRKTDARSLKSTARKLHVSSTNSQSPISLPLTRPNARALPSSPPAQRMDYGSLAVVYLLTLVAEAARGLILPSAWPYFREKGGTKPMLGVFMAAYSLGRAASTMPLNCLSDRVPPAALLSVAVVLQMAGHAMYMVAPSLPWLYASRVIVGLGSASTSLCRVHVARGVPPELRTTHFAYLSSLQFAGIAVMPAVGGFLSLLPVWHPCSFLTLNGLTYPALLLITANLMCLLAVCLLYHDPLAHTSPASKCGRSSSYTSLVSISSSTSPPSTPRYGATSAPRAADTPANPAAIDASRPRADACAIVVCLFVNVAMKGVLSELETVTLPFLQEQFDLHFSTASLCLSAMGIAGLLMYLALKPLADRWSDRILMRTGLLVTAVGTLPLMFPPVSRRLSMPMYVACLALTWSVGYPLAQTAVLSLFSKLLAGLPVGGLLGLFSMCGSIAPLVLAVLATKLWNELGRDAVYASMLGLTLTALLMLSCYYKRLVPASPIA